MLESEIPVPIPKMGFRLPAPKTYASVYNVLSTAGWKKTGADIKWNIYWGKLKSEME